MSYWISLVKDETPVEVENHKEGGTYDLNGSNVAELNVTYNYFYFFKKELDKEEGIRALDGDKAKKWVDKLKQAVDNLGDKPATEKNIKGDYWTPTPGNAGHSLKTLLEWAKQHPEAKFEVN